MLHSETKSKDVVVRKVNSRAKQLKDRKYLKEVNVKQYQMQHQREQEQPKREIKHAISLCALGKKVPF